jgi:hypothetical protein|tara:strand:+ start:326 stop:613 length:288 start_codon:yes stop_codon:yes gene_type:complete
MKVSKYYVGRKYSKFFDNLATRRHIIPVALYRTCKVNLNKYRGCSKTGIPSADSYNSAQYRSDDKGILKEMRYVVTNPDKETKLKEDDIVFVLAK